MNFNSLLVSLVPWDQLAALVVAAISAFVLPHVYTWLHISSNSKVRSDLDTALNNALRYGVGKITKNPASIVDNDALVNQVLAVAKDYINDNASTLVSKLKIGDPEILKALEARLLGIVDEVTFVKGRITTVAADPSKTVPAAPAPTPPTGA